MHPGAYGNYRLNQFVAPQESEQNYCFDRYFVELFDIF